MAFGAEIAELIVALKLDDRGFSGKINNAARSLRGMDAGLSQMGRGAGQVAGGLARLGTVAAVAAGGGLAAVVKTAASFEQAFTGVEKTVDGTEAQLAELEETLRAMARTTPVSFEELAGIAEAGGALGIARDSIDEFTDIVARLAVSTDLSSEQAATALGQLSNVLGLSAADMESFANSLVALGNEGASTESQIIDMAARFGAAGKQAGLSAEQILALSSTVASMGIESEAGGGALSRLFNNLTLDMATASSQGKLLARSMGLSLEELKDAWDQDAGGVFQDLLAHLNTLDQFKGAELLSNLGITNTRDINAVRVLAGGVQELSDNLDVATDHQQAMRVESDKFYATGISGWNMFKNVAKDALAIVGEEPLAVLNQEIRNFAAELDKPEVREGLRAFGTDLANGVKEFIGEIRKVDWEPILGGLQAAGTIAKGVLDLFRALPGPLQGLIVGGFALNKLSGGLVTGLGNIAVGGAKALFGMRGQTPANPMFVTQVVGLGGGLGGGAGGGLLGGLKTGFALASPVLAGVAAVEVINFQEMRNQATGRLETILDNMDRGSEAQTDRSIAAIQAQIDMERPWLEGILFNTNVRPVLEAELAELQNVKTATERAAAATRDAIPWAQRNVAETNRLNASEGTRAANLMALARQANALQASTGANVNRLASIPHNVNVDTHVNVNTTVGVSVLQQQAYRQRTATNYRSESTNTAGF